MKTDSRIDLSRFFIDGTTTQKQSIQRRLTTASFYRNASVYRWMDGYSYTSSTLLGKRVGVFKNQKTTSVPNITTLTYTMSSSSTDEQTSELITQI